MEQENADKKAVVIPSKDTSIIDVMSWINSSDKTGRPNSVALLISYGPQLHFVARLDDAAEVNELIASLQRHRDYVWPPTVGGRL